MQDAMYGLLGALGGATVAAAAAYWGPLQAQRRARHEADLERQRAQAEAQQERERAETGAALAQLHARQRAQVARVAQIRRVIGDWCHLLDRALAEVGQGYSVDLEYFRSTTALARASVTKEIYEALSDGINISGTRKSVSSLPGSTRFRVSVNNPRVARRIRTSVDPMIRVRHADQRLILDALDDATSDLVQLISLDPHDERWMNAREQAESSCQRAADSRAELSQRLMQRLVDLSDTETIDIRTLNEP